MRIKGSKMYSSSDSKTTTSQPNAPYVVWCSTPPSGKAVDTVIKAMYYLPQHFVLMIPGNTVTSDMISLLPIADRIHVYETNNSSSDELFHTAQAVVCEDVSHNDHAIPTVKITTGVRAVVKSASGYHSTTEPEAIATALLRLSRAAAQ